jgi:hypothetical protein
MQDGQLGQRSDSRYSLEFATREAAEMSISRSFRLANVLSRVVELMFGSRKSVCVGGRPS